MKIKTIVSQMRRDFRAIFVCEHCNYEDERTGYDDNYFHQKVIPKMICKKCNKTSDENYRPLTTKYDDNVHL